MILLIEILLVFSSHTISASLVAREHEMTTNHISVHAHRDGNAFVVENRTHNLSHMQHSNFTNHMLHFQIHLEIQLSFLIFPTIVQQPTPKGKAPFLYTSILLVTQRKIQTHNTSRRTASLSLGGPL